MMTRKISGQITRIKSVGITDQTNILNMAQEDRINSTNMAQMKAETLLQPNLHPCFMMSIWDLTDDHHI